MTYQTAFDRLFERGRDAVLAGGHYRDTPPVDGGRWGDSVVLRPPPARRAVLAEVSAEAMSIAGGGHWPTGVDEAVHVTVRALQPHRVTVPDHDPFVARCGGAVIRAAHRSRPVRLSFTGLTLTPSGVMACAHPVDNGADEFAGLLAEELGDDGWFEAAFHRDIWYATLLHFTGPLADPHRLVAWVAGRRRLHLGTASIAGAELVRFRFNGVQPVLDPLVAAPLRRAGVR